MSMVDDVATTRAEARAGAPPRMFQPLVDAVRVVPVPHARPRFDRRDEITGLTLLELSLRLDHVRRISEHLHLVDRGHLSRSVAVDVDLRALTRRQRDALAVRRDGHPAPAPVEDADDAPAERLWVPIARFSRDDLAPVVVADGSGAVAPRLTTHVTTRALTAGMTRLLRQRVTAQAAAAQHRQPEELLGHRSRWLIEQAMAQVIEHGARGWSDMPSRMPPPPQDTGSVAELGRIRERALAYLSALPRDFGPDFWTLVRLAATQHLLVVMAEPQTSHGHYTYESPLIPATVPAGWWTRWARDWLPVNREYTVRYDTELPRTLTSYHITIDVPEEIHVRRFVLSTDADVSTVRQLLLDLERLAPGDAGGGVHGGTDLGSALDPPGGEVHRAEIRDALARVASIGRLRFLNYIAYREYLAQMFQPYRWKPDPVPSLSATPHQLRDRIEDGHCTFWTLAGLAELHETGRLRELEDEPERLVGMLGGLRAYLDAADVGHDVGVDNDPRENGAHAFWRHIPLRFRPWDLEPVTARVHLSLADEPPALIESVSRMLWALLAVVLTLRLLSAGVDLWAPTGGFQQADAVVAVLLLVPGILLSRLDIPSTHSVLGTLRVSPRRIAYSSVIATSALAVAVAVESDYLTVLMNGAVVLLVLLILATWSEYAARRYRRHIAVPRSAVIPAWLTEAMAPDAPPTVRPPDAYFDVGRRAAQAAPVDSTPVTSTAADSTAGAGGKPDPSPRAGEHAGDPRAAALASLAARTASEAATGVEFSVAHVRSEPSTFTPESSVAVAPPSSGPAEGMGFTAFGATFEVLTRSVDPPAALESPTFVLPGLDVELSRSWSTAKGVATLNPRLPGGGRQYNEVMVLLGEQPDTNVQQALMCTQALADLMGRLAGADARPHFLYLPAAPPSVLSDSGREMPRGSVGPCIRMAVSNVEEYADARIAFETAACRWADEIGAGLSLSEGRASSEPTYWQSAVPFRPDTFARHKQALFGTVADVAPRELVMATLVGPVRHDTPRDLAAVAGCLRAAGCGVMATAAWALQQTVFLQVLLVRRPDADPAETATWRSNLRTALEDDDPADWMALLRREASLGTPIPTQAGETPDVPYRLVLLDTMPFPEHQTVVGQPVVPFWVSWDLPWLDLALSDLALVLRESFARCGHDAWVTFMRVRRNSADHVRGRAKLSVRVPVEWMDETGPRFLGPLAKRVQEDVRGVLAARHAATKSRVDLNVAWGERWLS
jgi:hypothetical protein